MDSRMELITGLEGDARLQYTIPWEMVKYFLNLESSLPQLQSAHKVGMGSNKILLEKFNESLVMKLLLMLESLLTSDGFRLDTVARQVFLNGMQSKIVIYLVGPPSGNRYSP
nr:hypothetical protein [Tanacetum cinerariifolium]